MILLPHKFIPRPYQLEVQRAFFTSSKKRFIIIWHRRAGKDRIWFNIMVGAALQRVGMYLYVFPTARQARKALWEGRDKAGIRFLDQIPRQLLVSVNNTEMRLELINGSIIRLGGTDNYDSWMGANPLGLVFSEYSLQNPLGWDLIRPILVENEGWAAFNYTPRARNHGYDLYKANKNNKKWFSSVLTVDDTKDWDNKLIVSKEAIQDEFDAGMSEDMIRQEFYCSFDAALRGAIFSLQLNKMHEENRVGSFPIDSSLPAFTFWDLGYDDCTSIWIMQPAKDGYWRAIYYYENQSQSLVHYVDMLNEIKTRLNILYLKHFLPHDALKHDLATGLTFLQQARKFGLDACIVKRIDEKEKAIELARVQLNKVYIHEDNCDHGLECLKSYQKVWYENLGIYSEKPLHNWASHGADSFMTFAQALNLNMLSMSDNNPQIRFNCVNTTAL